MVKTLSQRTFFKHLFEHVHTKRPFNTFILEIEEREPNWNYGIDNHAEFIQYMNPHDNCLWDALIPGYNKILSPNKQYIVKDIIGIYLLKNGNHKIIVKVYIPGYDPVESEKQVKLYMDTYFKRHNIPNTWIEIHGF